MRTCVSGESCSKRANKFATCMYNQLYVCTAIVCMYVQQMQTRQSHSINKNDSHFFYNIDRIVYSERKYSMHCQTCNFLYNHQICLRMLKDIPHRSVNCASSQSYPCTFLLQQFIVTSRKGIYSMASVKNCLGMLALHSQKS